MSHPSPRRRRRALGVADRRRQHPRAPAAATTTTRPAAGGHVTACRGGHDRCDDADGRHRRADATDRRHHGDRRDRGPTPPTRQRPTTTPVEPVAGGTLQIAVGNDAAEPQPAGRRQRQRHVVRDAPAVRLARRPGPRDRRARRRGWPSRGRSTTTPPTFTFHLRDDVTFSDGTPFTADVVKANFDDIIANGAKANAALPSLTGYVGYDRRRPADRHRHVLDTERPVPAGDVDGPPRLRRRRARWPSRSTSGPRPASSAPARSR